MNQIVINVIITILQRMQRKAQEWTSQGIVGECVFSYHSS